MIPPFILVLLDMHEWQLISLDHNYLQHQNVLYTRYIKNYCHFILDISAAPLFFVCAVIISARAILL